MRTSTSRDTIKAIRKILIPSWKNFLVMLVFVQKKKLVKPLRI